jgi:hypothetical protein
MGILLIIFARSFLFLNVSLALSILCVPVLAHREMHTLRLPFPKDMDQYLVQDQAQGKQAIVNPVFTKALEQVREKCKIPILLPAYLANEEEPMELYAIVEKASQDSYLIPLGFSADCAGGNACRWGTIIGEKVKEEVKPKGKKVRLIRNLTGYFQAGKCGAVCSDSKIVFYQGGYKYTFGIKAAKLDTMLKVVNSALKK